MNKLAIVLRTIDYRGDHASDVELPIEYKPGETIDDLVERSTIGTSQWARGEVLEIRLMAISV